MILEPTLKVTRSLSCSWINQHFPYVPLSLKQQKVSAPVSCVLDSKYSVAHFIPLCLLTLLLFHFLKAKIHKWNWIYSQICLKQLLKGNTKSGLCRQVPLVHVSRRDHFQGEKKRKVVFVDRWSLKQAWLYHVRLHIRIFFLVKLCKNKYGTTFLNCTNDILIWHVFPPIPTLHFICLIRWCLYAWGHFTCLHAACFTTYFVHMYSLFFCIDECIQYIMCIAL